jgi:hypothetical protein
MGNFLLPDPIARAAGRFVAYTFVTPEVLAFPEKIQ